VNLLERFVNIFSDTPHRREQYREQVWDILQLSYAPIGGIYGSGFQSPQDMDRIPMWKVAKKDDVVKAVAMYKDRSGRKMVAMGTDGTEQGKQILVDIIKNDFLTNRTYSELSGPGLRFTEKILGAELFNKVKIPTEKVIEILSDDYEAGEIEVVDQYRYQRKIGNNWVTKVMMGNPEAPAITR
jgi:hypothetical protein